MSRRFAHGLVVGKFYPPHLGHDLVISRAAAACQRVSVLVMAARTETVRLADRVAWLRASHASEPGVAVTGARCDIPVDFGSPAVWTAQVALMRSALANSASGRDGQPPVDAVFSSEPYGDELAARFGAVHVAVDRDRELVPVSGSEVRADLAGCWDFLAPAVRAGLAVRVVLLGAESTGTTTIARLLAAHYRDRGGAWQRTGCVAEAGRDYTIASWQRAIAAAAADGLAAPPLTALTWTAADFDAIAAEQTGAENAAAASGSPLLVCDTDALATAVWERRYLGPRTRPLQPWATALLARRDIYLLTSHEGVPWLDDGLREGDLAVRAAMTGWFAEALTAAGHSWLLLTGDIEQRLALAAGVTDYLLTDRFRFGPAVTDAAMTAAGENP